MSGIGDGPKFDRSSYDSMRTEILQGGGKGGDHVRGRDDGQVYLHKGFSGFGATARTEREAKFAQGGENMFEALKAKVGEKRAELLFSLVGNERGRDLKQEFKVSDFDRIDRLNRQIERELNTPTSYESSRPTNEPSEQDQIILRENPYRARWDAEEGKIVWS
jgi:hypothetical protein